jgi:putative ABC transport system ATP-binding protein
LLADEPTGNLDTKTSYEIMQLFHEIYEKGNTIIMVTHEEDIAKRYVMGSEVIDALKDVTITIKKGEYVAFMGPSGSGKSTLMNIIGCLDSPTSGSYVLNNKDVSGMSENELAEVRNKEIGFVFQTFNLLPRQSSLENVALPLIYAGYGKAARTEKAQAVLSSVGLGERSLHKPNELSGGQRQRVAVARALVNDPSILLADEPTGNLDTKTSYEIMQLFHEIYEKGNTIIMVTHEEDIANYAHRIIRLRDGLIESDLVNSNPTNPLEMAKKLAEKTN